MKINEKYISEKLVTLLNISSPSGDTKEAVDFIKSELDSFGISNCITTKGAIVGTIPGKNTEEEVTISGHIDTLGAMVKEIKSNGRLKLTQIGGYPWYAIDGEYCTISTYSGKKYRGTILHDKTSCHNYGEAAKAERTGDSIEVRIDELTTSKSETEKLGISVGDFIYLDPRVEISESGFIKSRHLDDKAGVIAILECARYFVENNIKPAHTLNLFISNYEEVGHGASGAIPPKTTELIAVDMASPGIGQESIETGVTICAKDSSGPYDLSMRNRLKALALEEGIEHRIDIYNFYGSDASAAMRAGSQIRHALIGPGVDASHAYERTHMKGIEETVNLLIAYLK